MIYAGQENGYVVLDHFCDLIISTGKDDYIQQLTAIPKSLLCLLHKQVAGNADGQAPNDALRMTVENIVKLDTEKA